MSKPIRVAILGATGAVGTELLELLENRQFPVKTLKLLASPRSAGKSLDFRKMYRFLKNVQIFEKCSDF